MTDFALYSQITPYQPQIKTSSEILLSPGPVKDHDVGHADRQLALVELRLVTQGVYVCENQANCTSPDVCDCTDGWTNFDCRTRKLDFNNKIIFYPLAKTKKKKSL